MTQLPTLKSTMAMGEEQGKAHPFPFKDQKLHTFLLLASHWPKSSFIGISSLQSSPEALTKIWFHSQSPPQVTYTQLEPRQPSLLPSFLLPSIPPSSLPSTHQFIHCIIQQIFDCDILKKKKGKMQSLSSKSYNLTWCWIRTLVWMQSEGHTDR